MKSYNLYFILLGIAFAISIYFTNQSTKTKRESYHRNAQLEVIMACRANKETRIKLEDGTILIVACMVSTADIEYPSTTKETK